MQGLKKADLFKTLQQALEAEEPEQQEAQEDPEAAEDGLEPAFDTAEPQEVANGAPAELEATQLAEASVPEAAEAEAVPAEPEQQEAAQQEEQPEEALEEEVAEEPAAEETVVEEAAGGEEPAEEEPAAKVQEDAMQEEAGGEQEAQQMVNINPARCFQFPGSCFTLCQIPLKGSSQASNCWNHLLAQLIYYLATDWDLEQGRKALVNTGANPAQGLTLVGPGPA